MLKRVSDTSLCGTSFTTSSCNDCHPSCYHCTTPGICDSCSDSRATITTDGAMCLCNTGLGGYNRFHTTCGACHETCATCTEAFYSEYCTSCVVQDATLPTDNSVGSCGCREGYVPITPTVLTEPCTPCAPVGCTNCIGSDESQCMSVEQALFTRTVAVRALHLPILTKTADNRICFRDELPSSGCTPDPIELVTGPIVDYATAAKPTAFQCYKLMKVQWAYLTYWFAQLFPGFEGPKPVTFFDLSSIKFILYLWILNFGPLEMNTWTDIKAAMNGPGENWKDYIAWVDTNPGFSLDAGVTVKAFPKILLDWLQSSYGMTSENVVLINIFYKASTVCRNASCSPTVKGYCTQINNRSACALS